MSDPERPFPSSWPASTPAAPPPAERPLRGRLLLLSVLVVLLVLVGSVAADDLRTHGRAGQQTQRADRLDGQLQTSRADVARLNGRVAELQADNSRLQAQAASPTVSIWNSCGGPCTMSPSAVRVGSVPDTFQLQISFSSDVPVRTYFFTFHQWTQFDGCGFSTRCVSGTYPTFEAATSLDRTFDDAEGCSGYVWVLQADAPGTIKPDVRARYQPADHPTGVCAASP